MSTIAELYARDPFDLSNQDLDLIIADLRGKLRNFQTVGVPAKSAQRTPPKSDPSLQLDIKL